MSLILSVGLRGRIQHVKNDICHGCSLSKLKQSQGTPLVLEFDSSKFKALKVLENEGDP